jgi:hypothetical protein
METDDEVAQTREHLENSDMRAILYLNQLSEMDMLQHDLQAVQAQVDAQYSIILQLVSVVNQLSPVPISIDENI